MSSNEESPGSAWSGLSLGGAGPASPLAGAKQAFTAQRVVLGVEALQGEASPLPAVEPVAGTGGSLGEQAWEVTPKAALKVLEPPRSREEALSLREGAALLASPSLESWKGVSPGLLASEGPEVARRAAEWERQIESLDRKEMEIHQTQLRLIREQTASFRGDLLALRGEVLELKAREEERSAASGRLERRCAELAEALGRQVQEEARRGLAGRTAMDRLAQELEVAKGRLDQLQSSVSEHHASFAQQACAAERVGHMERALGDSAERHSAALREAQVRLEQLHGRMASFEASVLELRRGLAALESSRLEGLQARLTAVERCGGEAWKRELREGCQRLEERLEEAEKRFGSKCQEERRAREQLSGASREGLAAEQRRREAQAAELEERLSGLERALGDCTERHVRELEAVKSRQLEALRASVGRRASLEERLDYVERWFQAFRPPRA